MNIAWPLPSRSGFALLEALFGASIMLMAILSVSVIFRELSAARSRADYITAISSVESALTVALLDERSYSDAAVKTALRSGLVPPNLRFRVWSGPGDKGKDGLEGGSGSGEFDFLVSPDKPMTFNSRTFRICSGFPSSNCDVRLELKISFASGEPKFAYKFEHHGDFNPSLLNYSGAGSSRESGWESTDFTLPLPYEYLYGSLHLGCSADHIGVMGFDRKTGLVTCISQPREVCPPNTFGKSLRFNTETNSVELNCSSPASIATCPAKYNLEQIDLTSLDAGGGRRSRCVYQYAMSAVGAPVGPAAVIPRATVCPVDYRSTSSCTLTNVKATAGQCPDYCSASHDETIYDGAGNVIGTNWICDAWTTPPPNPATAGWAILSQSGRSAGCSIYTPAQSCGATWQARVQLNVDCTLDIPEYVSGH